MLMSLFAEIKFSALILHKIIDKNYFKLLEIFFIQANLFNECQEFKLRCEGVVKLLKVTAKRKGHYGRFSLQI